MVVIKLRLYSLAVKVIQLASNGMRVLAGFDVLFKGRFVSMLAEKRRHEWRPMAQGSRDCRPSIISAQPDAGMAATDAAPSRKHGGNRRRTRKRWPVT